MNSRFQLSVKGDLRSDELSSLLHDVGMSIYTPQKLAGIISGTSSYVTVRDSGKLIGFGRLLTDGATLAYINNMAVDPGYQRQGIGRMILEKLVKIAGDVDSIFLYTNTADTLYKRFGFQLSEKRLYVLRVSQENSTKPAQSN